MAGRRPSSWVWKTNGGFLSLRAATPLAKLKRRFTSSSCPMGRSVATLANCLLFVSIFQQRESRTLHIGACVGGDETHSSAWSTVLSLAASEAELAWNGLPHKYESIVTSMSSRSCERWPEPNLIRRLARRGRATRQFSKISIIQIVSGIVEAYLSGIRNRIHFISLAFWPSRNFQSF